MQIVTQDKTKEFILDKDSKLFYKTLPRLEYLRIIGTPKNIRESEENKVDIDTKGLTKKEIEKLEAKEASIAGTVVILNNAVSLICDTNTVTDWEGFIDEDGKKVDFTQEYFKSIVMDLDMVMLTKLTLAITDDFYTNKKKVTSKKTKKTKKNSKT